MVLDLSKITGIGDYEKKTENIEADNETSRVRTLFLKTLDNPAPEKNNSLAHTVFLVDNGNTIEVRCDEKLSSLLTEKYESVMKSRYFGAGGIEIVLAGHQFSDPELSDLIRLSYNLSR